MLRLFFRLTRSREGAKAQAGSPGIAIRKRPPWGSACAGQLLAVTGRGRHNKRVDRIDSATLDRLPLNRIDSVTFFKGDELCTDLICCEIGVDGLTWFFHEEVEGWHGLLRHLEQLPGFRADWYGAVALSAFERCETTAFERGN